MQFRVSLTPFQVDTLVPPDAARTFEMNSHSGCRVRSLITLNKPVAGR